MTGKSRIISPFLFFFFFVFLALATDLVHGNHAYDQCVSACETINDLGNPVGGGMETRPPCYACLTPGPDMAAYICMQGCSVLKNEIEPAEGNKIESDEPKQPTGLFNHGVAILEANPNTLIAPGHWDADATFFVAQGKAILDLILQDKRETLGVKVGDIIRIPSGTKVLIINKDTMEKLVVIKFPQSVSTPDHSEVKLLNPFRGTSEVKLLNPFRGTSEVKLMNPFRSVINLKT